MPDSIVGLIIAIAMVLPGFVIVELSVVGRAQGPRSELELVLRALFYALILHLMAAYWTACLVGQIGSPDEWRDHLDELIPYALVVLIAAPIGLGSLLGWYLRKAERCEDRPSWLYHALGARDAGSAWDNIFQRLTPSGAWIIVELKSDECIGGLIGSASAIGQTPTPHDLYVQEIWTTEKDAKGVVNLREKIEPVQGIWLSESEIRSVRVIDPPYAE
jgi:hypothetical protein